jgi:hypothetical protein
MVAISCFKNTPGAPAAAADLNSLMRSPCTCSGADATANPNPIGSRSAVNDIFLGYFFVSFFPQRIGRTERAPSAGVLGCVSAGFAAGLNLASEKK